MKLAQLEAKMEQDNGLLNAEEAAEFFRKVDMIIERVDGVDTARDLPLEEPAGEAEADVYQDRSDALGLLDRWTWIGMAFAGVCAKHNIVLDNDTLFELNSVRHETRTFVDLFDMEGVER